MLPYQTTDVLERSFQLTPYTKELFKEFIEPFIIDFKNSEDMLQTLTDEIELSVFGDMSNDQMLDTITLTACQNIQEHIEYDKLASRLVAVRMYQSALQTQNSYSDFEELYKESFKEYIHAGIELKLLNPELVELFDLDELANAINLENDDMYTYIGIDTAHKRYMIRNRDSKPKTMETPQFMWMRIAMGLALKEDNPNDVAKQFYGIYSGLRGIPGGSTNIGSGTTVSVLSNCYLLDTQDDIHSIYDNVKNIALISKATGGIGISVSKLRASGSPVRSNNTESTGPIPFIKVMDTTLKSMARAGKKYGAMAVYMENWHLDFEDFMDLRQNAGDDYRRIRTANTAVYISDEFMKRVVGGDMWYMFDPLETPELTELYGSEFSAKYAEYVQKAEDGELKLWKKVPAREQMKRMVTTLLSTSHPWLTWKDTINLRALNNNTGTIHTSNLCTEICLPQDEENIAVCNLFHINLAQHIQEEGNTPEERVDWNKIKETVHIGMRHLDNLIMNNEPPVKEAKKSDQENRAVGFGMMGFTEIIEKLGYAYDSQEAYDLIDKVTEFVSYNTIEASCDLADERGSYDYFEGSMWSKGYVPIDTISKVHADRQGGDWDGATQKVSKKQSVVENIKAKIQDGIENARSEDTQELYQLFNQLASFIQVDKETGATKTREVVNEKGEGITLNQDVQTRLDWNSLRQRVQNGMRNATTMCIAPNASGGLLAGTTPGIDPRFSNIFSRATSRGKFLDINPNLVRKLEDLGIWDEVRYQVLENYGDISQIEAIPAEIRETYKTSFQVSPYAFIEVASRAQKWIDQSISRNMYLETRDIDEMVDIYTEAWRRGLKTTYYLHSKPRHTSEQSTIRVNKSEKIQQGKTQELAAVAAQAVTEEKTVAAAVASPARKQSGFGFGAAAARTTQPAKTEPSTQMSLDGKSEKKGFGFAAEKTQNETEQEQAEDKAKDDSVATQTNRSGGAIGFGKVASSSPVEEEATMEQANLKPETKWKPLVDACPVDPMERANCEACQ